ncbi:helix-turn-helix domain-containing protein [Desulfurivibrio alkaliphilus]|uniref:Heat shock protein DnaJ domain protein n=1 Tax=Desulfurivibrio alkaliphilus (strain DSM 19089 / UNIQEM U267 / AHT2) TaxID=589865 RepID=D6Z027_DESAT|nr:helix-turn-helix transcriptional regulator [Desulfurivibrio alkaliphilus]ADH87060.1 heat shock protein DnaJ domain protein [Desulfurivibrio alkaliphilus AHT 2]
MSPKMAELNHYELLELTSRATAQEIEQAYARARRTFADDSNAIYSLLSATELQQVRQQLDTAYRTLIDPRRRQEYDILLARPEAEKAEGEKADEIVAATGSDEPATDQADDHTRPHLPDKLAPPPAEIKEFTGAVLRQLRIQRDLTIKDVAEMTNIGTRYLEAIEEENFYRLPVRVYLRGYLALFAQALGYQPERVVADYLRRYGQEQPDEQPVTRKKSWWRP